MRHSHYVRNGARAVRLKFGQPSSLELLEPFSLGALIAAAPEFISHIYVTLERELQDGSGYLICGEGLLRFGRLLWAPRRQ